MQDKTNRKFAADLKKIRQMSSETGKKIAELKAAGISEISHEPLERLEGINHKLADAIHDLERLLDERASDLIQAKAEAEASFEVMKLSKENFRRTFDQSPVGAAIVDLDQRFLNVNKALCRITGYSEKELTSLTLPCITQPEDLEKSLEFDRKLRSGEIDEYQVDQRYIRRDGSVVWVQVSARAVRDPKGQIVYFLPIIQDISDRKLADEELYDYRRNLELLVQERTAELLSANSKLEQEIIARRRAEEILSARNCLLNIMSSSESRKEYLDAVVKQIQQWSGCRCVGIRILDDRGAIPYESYVGFTYDFWSKENFLLLSRDNCVCTRIIRRELEPQDNPCITPGGSFRCQDSLSFISCMSEEEKSRFRGICIASGFISIGVTPILHNNVMVGAIHLADPRPRMLPDSLMETLESNAQIIGEAILKFKTRDDLRQTYENQQVVDSILRFALEDHNLKTILEHALEKVLSTSALPLESGGSIVLNEDSGIQAVIAGRGISREVQEHHDYSIPIVSADRTLGVISVTARDGHIRTQQQEDFLLAVANALAGVIERKRIEQELCLHVSRIEMSNRDLEQFAYVASHDLAEPLRKIKVFNNLVISKIGHSVSEEVLDRLQRVQDASGRMESLLRDLLSYSRISTRQKPFETIELRRIAEEVVSDLWVRVQRSDAKIEIGDLPVVEADPTQMRQLFQNLLANSLKFHAEAPPHVRVYGKTEDGQFWIFVQDNGIGFDEAYLDRIFDPFQRLHGRSQFEGAGMGLAICRRIVERHGGSITAKSTPGKGSTFIIALPRQRLRRRI